MNNTSIVIEKLRGFLEKVNTDLEINTIYLFGSAIYDNGIMFSKDNSDVDLMIIIPDDLVDCLSRKKWLKKLKSHKKNLENELYTSLNRVDGAKQIVSILPVTKLEISYNIHKSGSRDFFARNEFMDISTGSKFKGENYFEFSKLKDELFFSIISGIQNVRNKYLKNTISVDHDVLAYIDNDILPKDLLRSAAMADSYNKNKLLGDEFNLSFGLDFLTYELKELVNNNLEYKRLYNIIDARRGGRTNLSDTSGLDGETVCFYFEFLLDKSIEILKKKKVKVVVNDDFNAFLNNSDIFSKSHGKKELLTLSDIWVSPRLRKIEDKSKATKKSDFEELYLNLIDEKKVIVSGENQSGKTTVIKKIYKKLLDNKFTPLYFDGSKGGLIGNLDTKVDFAVSSQYKDQSFSEIESDSVVIILDNFHEVVKKSKVLNYFDQFKFIFITTDDIFKLIYTDNKLLKEYSQFVITEFSPSQRNELIKNWLSASDYKTDSIKGNAELAEIDRATELVNTSLGKIIGGGIIPSYPFFILSILSTHETFQRPLEQEITSQGYCYQALIYFYLRKQGVSNSNIDTYINFLTELAYALYDKKRISLTQEEFDEFLASYTTDFNLMVSVENLITDLEAVNIVAKDNFNNVAFCYSYIYYFFVAKYLADNLDSKKEDIDVLVKNLHIDRYAYIAVFVSHHSKNEYVLDQILLNAMYLLDGFSEASLEKQELDFFDRKEELIVKAVLPESLDHAKTRDEILKELDGIEDSDSSASTNSGKEFEFVENDENDEKNERDTYLIDIRRSVKTVEVMGRIIKNRAGSLPKERLKNIFREALNINLRLLSSFFEMIKDEETEEILVEFIKSRLVTILNDEDKLPDDNKLENLVKKLFWNMNYFFTYKLLDKTIHSLGSDKLRSVIIDVCDDISTPASFIVKHGIFMWFNKNLQIENISDGMIDVGFSETAKTILRHKIVTYCRLHHLNFRDIRDVENKLGIPKRNFLLRKKN